jgi:hypothetical protein
MNKEQQIAFDFIGQKNRRLHFLIWVNTQIFGGSCMRGIFVENGRSGGYVRICKVS